MEAESNLRPWESEAKEVVERAVLAEAERDAANHDVTMARLDTEVAGSARTQVESELTRVQHALVSSKDAQQKVESELKGIQQDLVASGKA